MHQSYTLANSILGQACYTKNEKYNELRAYNMNFININKIVMTIIKHDRVVARLPIFVQQNINAHTPLKFKGRLEVRTSKINASKLYRS